MFKGLAQKTALRILAFANAKMQATLPAEQRSYRVAITGAGEPQIETVDACSAIQAAERAAANVANKRLKSTSERSWRLTAIVDEFRFDVDVSCYLKAEVCGSPQ